MWKLHEEKPKNNLYYISDRRWMKIVRLLKTSAFLNGRTEVDLMDCSLISHCIWNSNDVIDEVSQIVNNAIVYEGEEFATFVDSIGSKIQEFNRFVDKNFFEEFRPIMYEMKDGSKAYKIIPPVEILLNKSNSISACYLSPRYGYYYDQNRDRLDSKVKNESFRIEKSTIEWKDDSSETECSAKIEMELQKSSKLFGYWIEGNPKMVKMLDGKDAYEFETLYTEKDYHNRPTPLKAKYFSKDLTFYRNKNVSCNTRSRFKFFSIQKNCVVFRWSYSMYSD